MKYISTVISSHHVNDAWRRNKSNQFKKCYTIIEVFMSKDYNYIITRKWSVPGYPGVPGLPSLPFSPGSPINPGGPAIPC